VSSIPTPVPTPHAETQFFNATNFTELKALVEKAPSCGVARVRVGVTGRAMHMGLQDAAIEIPPSSCITLIGGEDAIFRREESRRLNGDEIDASARHTRLYGNGIDRLFYAAEHVRGFVLQNLVLANGYAGDGSGGAIEFAAGCQELVVNNCG
jgi:hypothetical protein